MCFVKTVNHSIHSGLAQFWEYPIFQDDRRQSLSTRHTMGANSMHNIPFQELPPFTVLLSQVALSAAAAGRFLAYFTHMFAPLASADKLLLESSNLIYTHPHTQQMDSIQDVRLAARWCLEVGNFCHTQTALHCTLLYARALILSKARRTWAALCFCFSCNALVAYRRAKQDT